MYFIDASTILVGSSEVYRRRWIVPLWTSKRRSASSTDSRTTKRRNVGIRGCFPWRTGSYAIGSCLFSTPSKVHFKKASLSDVLQDVITEVSIAPQTEEDFEVNGCNGAMSFFSPPKFVRPNVWNNWAHPRVSLFCPTAKSCPPFFSQADVKKVRDELSDLAFFFSFLFSCFGCLPKT